MSNTTEKQKAREGWGWTNIIDEFERLMYEVDNSLHHTLYQKQFVLRHIKEFLTGLHENAESAFLLSHMRESYIDYRAGKNGEYLALGVLLYSEYWQQFARTSSDHLV